MVGRAPKPSPSDKRRLKSSLLSRDTMKPEASVACDIGFGEREKVWLGVWTFITYVEQLLSSMFCSKKDYVATTKQRAIVQIIPPCVLNWNSRNRHRPYNKCYSTKAGEYLYVTRRRKNYKSKIIVHKHQQLTRSFQYLSLPTREKV